MIKVIHIFGAAGAGTSTLGKLLKEKYGYKWLDVDEYYWLKTKIPFTQARVPVERVELIKKEIENNEKVVISGSLCGWGDVLIPYFDLVIKINTPTSIRLNRLNEREKTRFGSRVLPGGDMYQNHLKFIDWASLYDDGDVTIRSDAMHMEWLKKIKVPTIIMSGTLSDADSLKIISEYFN